MQAYRKISFLLIQYIPKQSVSNYRGDIWKERDEASEKVYIAESESTYLVI